MDFGNLVLPDQTLISTNAQVSQGLRQLLRYNRLQVLYRETGRAEEAPRDMRTDTYTCQYHFYNSLLKLMVILAQVRSAVSCF